MTNSSCLLSSDSLRRFHLKAAGEVWGGGWRGGVRAWGVSGDYAPLTSRFHLQRKMDRLIGPPLVQVCWRSSSPADEIIYLYNLLNFYCKFFFFFFPFEFYRMFWVTIMARVIIFYPSRMNTNRKTKQGIVINKFISKVNFKDLPRGKFLLFF